MLFIIGFTSVLSALVTGLVVRFGQRLGIVDDPATHTHSKVIHSTPVPRGGGIPVLITVVLGIVLWLPLDTQVIGIIAGVVILALWGWLDDRNEERISPYLRLVFGNTAAALAVVITGTQVAYITNPLGGVVHLDSLRWCFGPYCFFPLSAVLTVLWLVWMQNIVGWSSGVDGQLPGFVVIAAIAMLLLAQRFSQTPVTILAAITTGAYLGFLPWNWYPQKIMPGYGGKSLAGFLLAVLAVLSFGKVGAMVMVLGVPFTDAVMVVIKRVREGRSVVMGGREHMHHYLLELGWSKPKISLFYTAMSLLFAWLALSLKPQAKLFTMAAAVLILTGTILWLQNWSTYSKPRGPANG